MQTVTPKHEKTTEFDISDVMLAEMLKVAKAKAMIWNAIAFIALLSVLPAAIVMIAIARIFWEWAR